MKLLYYIVADPDRYNTARLDWKCDYQLDSLLHGLKSILSPDELVEYPKAAHLYQNFPEDVGRRFSLYKLLPDESVDRDDLTKKIENRYFDKIVLAFHHSHNSRWNYWNRVIQSFLEYYPAEKLVVLDGWDLPDVDKSVVDLVKYYFKREIGDGDLMDRLGMRPIQFGIPEEKLRPPLEKEFAFAPHIPACFSWDGCPHIKTYTYNDEESFYRDYQKSYFAYTCKKGGWDTMKTLEILAGGCIPFFLDIERCPPQTLFHHPKKLYMLAKNFGLYGVDDGRIDRNEFICDTRNIREGGGSIYFKMFDKEYYDFFLSVFMNYTRKYLTTQAVARRFLDEITI